MHRSLFVGRRLTKIEILSQWVMWAKIRIAEVILNMAVGVGITVSIRPMID